MGVTVTITADSAVEVGAQMRHLCGATPPPTENEEHRAIVAEVKRLQHREVELQEEIRHMAESIRGDGLAKMVSDAQAERDVYKLRARELEHRVGVLEAQVTMADREASSARGFAPQVVTITGSSPIMPAIPGRCGVTP